MYRIIVFALAIFATTIPAMVHADELDEAYADCTGGNGAKDHRLPAVGLASQQKLWESGWEHCQPIRAAKVRRDTEKALADEKTNPALKRSRDVAKKLLGQ